MTSSQSDGSDLVLEVCDPFAPAALSAVRRYVAELAVRFDDGFLADPEVDAERFAAPDGVFVLATRDGMTVGCGGVQRLAADTGEIKRMWVAPEARGTGLGRRLLTRLEQECAGLGHARVRLDTNDALTEAIAMYDRSGYTRIECYNDNPYARFWFEKALVLE